MLLPSRSHLELVLGQDGPVLRHLGAILEHLETILSQPGVILEPSWSSMRPS